MNEKEKIYLTSKVFREINLQYDLLFEKVDFTEFFEKLGNCESKNPNFHTFSLKTNNKQVFNGHIWSNLKKSKIVCL